MKQTLATALGFFAASILPAAYLATAFPLSGIRDLQSISGSFIVFYYFAAVATVVLGFPMFLILKKLKLVTWWSTVGSGVSVGTVAIFAVTLGGDMDLTSLLRYAMLGGAAGFIFWIFWRLGRGNGVKQTRSAKLE
jgi:hypothetical protein